MKNKLGIFLLSLTLVGGVITLPSCSSTPVVEDYYQIDTSSILNEMLVNFTMKIEPRFTNLGVKTDAKYSLVILFEGEDVTASSYDATTKIFHPTATGEYRFTFTVLKDDGEVYKTKEGKEFSKSIIVNVVSQSFAAIDSDGRDVTISNDGVLTFGEYYKTNEGRKADSGQYKVTGISFNSSYSITYKIENAEADPAASDPALYFGWIKDWQSANDDSLKIGFGGNLATWIWGKNGDIADLSSNRKHGWTKGEWWDAPGSMGSLAGEEHYLTFERYVNNDLKKATYGILFDHKPFTYLDVGDAYSDLLKNVWVESINVSCSISVTEFKTIDDKEAPTLSLNLEDREFEVGDVINLKALAQVKDNSPYASILVPSFRIFSDEGVEQAVENGNFTPLSKGRYKVTAEVCDLMNNTASCEGTLVVNEKDLNKTQIDLDDISSVAMPNSGIILYPKATKLGEDVEIKEYRVLDEEDDDVTEFTIKHFESKDGLVERDYFIAPEGNYKLIAIAEDGTEKSKDINVAPYNTVIYGMEYFDIGTLVYENKFAIGRNEVLYFNIKSNDRQTVKLGSSIAKGLKNWTIEYDVTDMYFQGQGKFIITKNTLNSNGQMIGWEDLTIGGKSNGNNQEFWGYECKLATSEWESYQWRSTWQNPTTEFMPDPSDHSKGCGREANEYQQYLLGTHSFKLECVTDEETDVVTYRYYIDGELEAVHVSPASHNDANIVDFYQLSAERFNGLISNFRIY